MSSRRLIVMRHAKSSWDDATLDDHQRPLNGRGRREAPQVGRALEEMGWVPDRVIASDSARTLETWARMRTVLGEIPLESRSELYHAGVRALGELARDWSPDLSTLLVLGHNPGWSHLASMLAGEPLKLKTAHAALLETDVDGWSEALTQPWRLVHVIRPKDLT